MGKLTHLDTEGRARMVDVSAKERTLRSANATGVITMGADALALAMAGNGPKGSVEGVARIAGIMAAKRTADLIPLCHPLALSGAEVAIAPAPEGTGLQVTATIRTSAQTGVEMEALTAVSVALLTIYDMLKAVDTSMTISGVRLVEKTGGRSGAYRAETP